MNIPQMLKNFDLSIDACIIAAFAVKVVISIGFICECSKAYVSAVRRM